MSKLCYICREKKDNDVGLYCDKCKGQKVKHRQGVYKIYDTI